MIKSGGVSSSCECVIEMCDYGVLYKGNLGSVDYLFLKKDFFFFLKNLALAT